MEQFGHAIISNERLISQLLSDNSYITIYEEDLNIVCLKEYANSHFYLHFFIWITWSILFIGY